MCPTLVHYLTFRQFMGPIWVHYMTPVNDMGPSVFNVYLLRVGCFMFILDHFGPKMYLIISRKSNLLKRNLLKNHVIKQKKIAVSEQNKRVLTHLKPC